MIVFHCSQADEYKNCIDNFRCTQNDTAYQLHLLSLGFKESYSFLCENDTLQGCTRTQRTDLQVQTY